jgi:Mg2+/citrate symporter
LGLLLLRFLENINPLVYFLILAVCVAAKNRPISKLVEQFYQQASTVISLTAISLAPIFGMIMFTIQFFSLLNDESPIEDLYE